MKNIGLGITSAAASCSAIYLLVNGHPSEWAWAFAVFCVWLMEGK